MEEERHFDNQVRHPHKQSDNIALNMIRNTFHHASIFFDYVNKHWRSNELKELWIMAITWGITCRDYGIY